jgi:hypothetical protein
MLKGKLCNTRYVEIKSKLGKGVLIGNVHEGKKFKELCWRDHPNLPRDLALLIEGLAS